MYLEGQLLPAKQGQQPMITVMSLAYENEQSAQLAAVIRSLSSFLSRHLGTLMGLPSILWWGGFEDKLVPPTGAEVLDRKFQIPTEKHSWVQPVWSL